MLYLQRWASQFDVRDERCLTELDVGPRDVSETEAAKSDIRSDLGLPFTDI